MKKTQRFRLTVMLVVLALLTVVCANLDSGSQEAVPVTASIKEFSGRVQVLKASEGEFRAASIGTILETNDQVLTGEDGRARIDLSDGTIIRLSPLSNFVLTAVQNTDQGTLTRLQLNIGRLWIILKGGVVEVDTPSGLASVRGSYLHVWVDPMSEETNVTCLEGECALGNDLGSVSLVAGQTAKISGTGEAPEAGKMTHEDVSEWLDENPEATLVVVPLTATVAAGAGEPLPQLETNTPTPTHTQGPTPTLGPSSTPTKTLLSVDCGPFEGWVLHTVREGETLKTLSLLYRVTETELRQANCRGEMDFIVTGEKLYVPNVATSTPTSTPTVTPKFTATVVGGGGGGATATATNSPTTMSSPVGPDNTTVSKLLDCYYSYKVNVVDPDGITEVKMIYTFDGSLPDYNVAVGAGMYKLLPKISGDTYGVTNYVLDTSGQTPPVGVRFRFTAKDSLGNLTYFPVGDAYDLTDTVGCGTNATPTSNVLLSPDGALLQSLVDCPKDYKIDIADDNGIKEVKMYYTVSAWDGSGYNNTSPSAYQIMNLTLANGAGTGGEYSLTVFIVDTTGFGPVAGPPLYPSKIDFDFVVFDKLGTQTTVFSGTFDDEVGCIVP